MQAEQEYLDRDRETKAWSKRRKSLDDRFRRTLALAAEKSAAYREILWRADVKVSDINGLDDLEKLPVIRMSELVERQKDAPPFGGFEVVPAERIRRIYVNPGAILQPGDWDYADTSWAESLRAAGIGPGDRMINTFNYHMWPVALMLDDAAKMAGATILPMGVGNTMVQVRVMKSLEITAFLGTPSFLMTLAQSPEGLGVDPDKDLHLEKALVGAEMLPESLRTRLSLKLGIEIRQFYGTALLGCLGYECRHLSGLHVPDNVIVEVVDPSSGRPVSPGAAGEIVATCFSPTYPLIRLATGDLSVMTQEQCPCGRTGPQLKRVLGRLDQAAKVRGTFVHPWQADEVVARHPEVFKYQVVITRKKDIDRMTFRVELTDESADAGMVSARLARDIKEMITVKGEVEVLPRGTIPDFHKKIDDQRSWD